MTVDFFRYLDLSSSILAFFFSSLTLFNSSGEGPAPILKVRLPVPVHAQSVVYQVCAYVRWPELVERGSVWLEISCLAPKLGIFLAA
jgi:hypothetical protein